VIKLPRTNTKTFKVLKFIGSNPVGVRPIDVEKFIVELSGDEWNSIKRCGAWRLSLYGYSDKQGIYKTYCTKVNDRWFLKHETMVAMQTIINDDKLYARASTTTISDFDAARVRDLSVSNAEQLPNLPARPNIPLAVVKAIEEMHAAKAVLANLDTQMSALKLKCSQARTVLDDKKAVVLKALGIDL